MTRRPANGGGGRVRGPTGETFRILGPAGPVRLRPAPPIPAEAGGEILVVKQGGVFVCSRRDGDIHPERATGEGVYAHDTRYLSDLRLKVSGKTPVLLSSSADRAYEAFIDLTNPTLRIGRVRVPQMSLGVRRVRLVNERVYERVQVANHGRAAADLTLELSLGADFADIFEVRGARRREPRGKVLAPKPSASGVAFGYVGRDDLFRQTLVTADPAPDVRVDEDRATFTWPVHVEPGETFAVTIGIEPSLHGGRSEEPGPDEALRRVEAEADAWGSDCSSTLGLHPWFNRVVAASMRDLRTLTIQMDGHRLMTAGVPWFVAPFGRDALLTCQEALMLNPGLARDTLRFLALHQARADDPERDAEPGKILHELRVGELARSGLIPHTPYYGSIDSTPLFLVLAGSYYRWTADLETMAELRPAFDAALAWMDEHGDRDGDGFLEYERRSTAGLLNQGWKDSEDAIVHPDGSLADGPIALAEVQGYAYLARQRIAEAYDALGEGDRADTLRKQAAELKEAFNDAFWMQDEGTFALGLDGRKRQIRSVASNAGHCLYCGIADEDKGRRVSERLLAEDMFSGWGVRTLSSASPAYNPLSYHNGSVWPHDNAIVAAGLKRYGAVEGTERIVTAMFDAALLSPEARLPELICGFRRRPNIPYAPYPVACRPQAWAAAAPFMILQALLGISARAPQRLLTIIRPALPEWLGSVEIRNLRVGDARVGLSFTRSHGAAAVALLQREGDVRVSIHQE